jgi:hypothetical protein
MSLMTTSTAPAMSAADRARLASAVSKQTARLAHLDKILPIMIEKSAFYRGRVAEAELRRASSALALVEQHLAGSELAEARLSHNLNCLKNSDAETAVAFATVLGQAVLAARAERDRLVAAIAADEVKLGGAK